MIGNNRLVANITSHFTPLAHFLPLIQSSRCVIVYKSNKILVIRLDNLFTPSLRHLTVTNVNTSETGLPFIR